MQKREWNAFVRDRLSIGSETIPQISIMDWRIIDVYIERAITSRLGDMVRDASKTKDFSFLDIYTKTYYKVPILFDDERKLYYSYIPPIIQLDENKGIRSLSFMQDESMGGAQMTNDAMKVFGKLEVSKIALDVIPYFLEANKIFYTALATCDYKMLLKLVIPYTDWDDYDEIPEPYFKGAIAQDGSEDILGSVMAQLVNAKLNPANKEDKLNIGEPV